MISPIKVDEYGVSYFTTPKECIKYAESKPWIKKALYYIQSFGTLFLYSIDRTKLAFKKIDKDKSLAPYMNKQEFTKRRLIVCLHGLNNSPRQFNRILAELKKYDLSETDIYIPKILDKGNASQSEMVEDSYAEILKWSQLKGENKKLSFLTVSNGAKIGNGIIAKLMNDDNFGKFATPNNWVWGKKLAIENKITINFVSIVGANFGSSLVDLAKRLHLSWILSKNIAAEMGTKSNCIRNIREKLQTEKAKNCQFKINSYYFASTCDWQVNNYSSTLPEPLVTHANRRFFYAIIPGHGHNSIVNKIAKSVAAIALENFF